MTPDQMQQSFDECQELVKAGEYETAARQLTDILGYVSHPLVANLLGFCLQRMKRFEKAERVWIEALKDDPNCVPVLANLANIFRERHRFEPARELLDHALSCKPYNFQALHNRAVLAMDEGEWGMAHDLSSKACELKDDDACNHTLSLAKLQIGDFDGGLSLYGGRHSIFNRDIPPLPKYEGGEGKVIIRQEQGFGDTLMAARWFPKLQEMGADVYLSAPSPLHRILEQSGLCKIDDGQTEDYTHFMYTMDTMPMFWGQTDGEAYLKADPADVEKYAKRQGSGKKVGICYSGGCRPDDPAVFQIDRRRSLSPSEAMQIVRMRPDLDWINLTREWGLPGVADFGSEISDFAEMAGLLSNLDLVITVDTALAHLAGGLGIDTIMLSRFDACWRWYPYTMQTKLYRTMSCLYQPEPFDWQSVIDELQVDLEVI